MSTAYNLTTQHRSNVAYATNYSTNNNNNVTSQCKNVQNCTSDATPADRRRLVPGARCHSNAGGGRSCSRTVFTRAQLDALEDRFVRQSFLTREERIEFAEQIDLTERQILVWFQNRR